MLQCTWCWSWTTNVLPVVGKKWGQGYENCSFSWWAEQMSACNDDVRHDLCRHISRLNYLLLSLRCKYDRASCHGWASETGLPAVSAGLSFRKRLGKNIFILLHDKMMRVLYGAPNAPSHWSISIRSIWKNHCSYFCIHTGVSHNWNISAFKIWVRCMRPLSLFSVHHKCVQDYGLIGLISASKRCHWHCQWQCQACCKWSKSQTVIILEVSGGSASVWTAIRVALHKSSRCALSLCLSSYCVKQNCHWQS